MAADEKLVQKKAETTVETSVSTKSTKEKPKKPKKAKKPNRIARSLKETGSELKKVSWPTFPKVVKQTGVVIAVVIIFTAVIFGIDRLLGWLYTLLLKIL